MIEINLLPQEFRRKEKREIKIPKLPYMRMFLIFLGSVFLVEGLIFAYVQIRKAHLSGLEKQYEALKPEIREYQKYKSEAGRLQAEMQALTEAGTRPYSWTRLLGSVSDAITPGIWLRKLTLVKETPPAIPADSAAKTASKTGSKDTKPKTETPKPALPIETLKIFGSIQGSGDEAADVSRFLQGLKKEPYLSEHMADALLERMDQNRKPNAVIYDFEISCRFKRS